MDDSYHRSLSHCAKAFFTSAPTCFEPCASTDLKSILRHANRRRGAHTPTGPIPVMISRSGKMPVANQLLLAFLCQKAVGRYFYKLKTANDSN
jgi:hypothetical protein